MSDYILITGDKAAFNPTFGQAIVAVRPGDLIGTGKDKINQKLVCVDGDEKKVIVPGCPYMTPQYSIPGVGILSITSLAGNQKAKKTKSGGKPVLLKGASFQAKFQVMVPAQQPSVPNPIPDATPQYSGTGTFMSMNTKVKAT
jgi:Contractile injection system spike tip protein